MRSLAGLTDKLFPSYNRQEKFVAMTKSYTTLPRADKQWDFVLWNFPASNQHPSVSLIHIKLASYSVKVFSGAASPREIFHYLFLKSILE